MTRLAYFIFFPAIFDLNNIFPPAISNIAAEIARGNTMNEPAQSSKINPTK